MLMKFKFEHIPIDIDSHTYPVIPNINWQIWFIPTEAVELLLSKREEIPQLSSSYITRYFTVLGHLINQQSGPYGTTSARGLNKIRGYKSFIRMWEKSGMISGKVNYSTTGRRCNKYILNLHFKHFTFNPTLLYFAGTFNISFNSF